MKRLRCFIVVILAMLSISSCASQIDIGIITTIDDSVIVTDIKTDGNTSTDIPVQDVIVTVNEDEPSVTDGTAVTTETEETASTEVTEMIPVPEEPDPSVFSQLETLLTNPPSAGAKISFCYEDLTTGISYFYNGDTVMWNASIMKLPIAMSILYNAETQDVGLEDVYVYSENDYREGTGEIIHKPVGTSYTYIELVDYMLRYSDNVALDQVRRKYGQYYHHDYVNSIGANGFSVGSGWSATAKDCSLLLRSTYEYLEGDFLYSERIKDDMINSFHQVMLSPGLSGKPIARKYGWDTEGYNDIGIVYDEHPYMLVFMSDMTNGGATVNSYISEIARTADSIHENLWQTVEADD